MPHPSLISSILEKLMRILDDPYWWTMAFSAVVQLTVFFRWIYRRIRDDEITRGFVGDLAKIHLPHIYVTLEQICNQQGLAAPARPQINWVDLHRPNR